MKALMILIITYTLFFAIACTAGRQVTNESFVINHASIQIKMDTVKGFEDLANSQYGYSGKYQKLIDSLNLINADTVGFFIRPCFTHRGVLFKIEKSKCNEFYFNFSDSFNKISMKDNLCKVANDFFFFACDSKFMNKGYYNDSVVVVPDCPVILFLKLKNVFYHRKLTGKDLEYFSDSSIAFKGLLKEVSR